MCLLRRLGALLGELFWGWRQGTGRGCWHVLGALLTATGSAISSSAVAEVSTVGFCL